MDLASAYLQGFTINQLIQTFWFMRSNKIGQVGRAARTTGTTRQQSCALY
jgi:hypothetical protein